MSFNDQIQSVNLHITKACNYRCRFCFAHFNQLLTPVGKDEWKQIIAKLYQAGTRKVTFVGGEPTLIKYLPELIKFAKSLGLTTMLVTNGTRVTQSYLASIANNLDWIGLSIDSGREKTNKELGRGTGNHVAQTLRIVELARSHKIKVKLNSVITRLNYKEDMNWLITRIRPHRWKVFQMLPIDGENNEGWDLLITKVNFKFFIKNHLGNNPIAETNELMTDSYVMIDPEGRFFNNSNGSLTHGVPILETDLVNAYEKHSNFSLNRFLERDGDYFHKTLEVVD